MTKILIMMLASAGIAFGQYYPPSGGGTPSGTAGGDLGGSYPNPTAVNAVHLTNFPSFTTMGLGSAATNSASAFDASGAAAAAQSASLQKANNLSDVASAATARTNLAVPGTATANSFTAPQTMQSEVVATGPVGWNNTVSGDSRSNAFSLTGVMKGFVPEGGSLTLAGMLSLQGFGVNSPFCNTAISGKSVEDMILYYSQSSFTITGNITTGTMNLSSLSGSTGSIPVGSNFGVGGIGLQGALYGSYPGSGNITLHSGGYLQNGSTPSPTATTTSATIDIANTINGYSLSLGYQTPHELSPAVMQPSNASTFPGVYIDQVGVNDQEFYTGKGETWNFINGSPTATFATNSDMTPCVGATLSGTGITGGTTITGIASTATTITFTMSNNFTGTTGSHAITISESVANVVAAHQVLEGLAVADGYNYVFITVPKAYASLWVAGEAMRTGVNSAMLAAYGTTPLGNGAYSGTTAHAFVIDSASMSIFGTNNTQTYNSDGLHFSSSGQTQWGAFIDQALFTLFPSNISFVVQPVGAFIPWESVQMPTQFSVDNAGLIGNYYFAQSGSGQLAIWLGGERIQNNGGSLRFVASGGQIQSIPNQSFTFADVPTMTSNATATATFNANGLSETIYNTTTGLAATTINLPVYSQTGQIVRYVTNGTSDVITMGTGTVDIGNAPGTLAGPAVVAWQADTSGGHWIRIQ